MQRFTDLKVWQRSHSLTLDLYRLSQRFPISERFGLTSQLRRAVTAVPTNIAEGCKRRRNPDFARFLNIAESSLSEAEYLLVLARDLKYISRPETEALQERAIEIARMLYGLLSRVEAAAT